MVKTIKNKSALSIFIIIIVHTAQSADTYSYNGHREQTFFCFHHLNFKFSLRTASYTFNCSIAKGDLPSSSKSRTILNICFIFRLMRRSSNAHLVRQLPTWVSAALRISVHREDYKSSRKMHFFILSGKKVRVCCCSMFSLLTYSSCCTLRLLLLLLLLACVWSQGKDHLQCVVFLYRTKKKTENVHKRCEWTK